MSRPPRRLSSKAAALLADLNAHASEKESQYIGGLVQAATRRKAAAEAAFEKKQVEQASGDHVPLSFVTKEYQEKLEASKQVLDDSSLERAVLQNAEVVDATAAGKTWSKSSTSLPHVHTQVQVEQLIAKRDARRSARLAPATKLSDEMIEQARQRAIKRLKSQGLLSE